MKSKHFDVIVLGVGGMGSAAVYELAKRGKRVLGLEQFDIPHAMGSSHGQTRIIRLAYNEHPHYVPLLHRSYELWRNTELLAGEPLLHITGGIDASREQNRVFSGALASCQKYQLPHEVYTAKELKRQYPAFDLPDDVMACYQPDAGFLLPERCIVAHVNLAMALGAEVHGREKVIDWQPYFEGVKVVTDKGEYTADKLVITAGAWSNKLLDVLAPGVAVPERQVLIWMQPKTPQHFAMGKLPVWIVEVDEGFYYGFPVYGIPGFKFGRFRHLEEVVDPDTMDRGCHDKDEQLLRSFAERYMPEACGPTMSMASCMFTNTPDEHFIVDKHPEHEQVVFGAGFSGHGFKFASVMGEILADLAVDGQTAHSTDLFRLSRFGQTS